VKNVCFLLKKIEYSSYIHYYTMSDSAASKPARDSEKTAAVREAMTKRTGLYIPVSRVNSHVDEHGINSAIEAQINEWSDKQKAVEAARTELKDGKPDKKRTTELNAIIGKEEDIKLKLKSLHSSRYRFRESARIGMASVVNEMAKQLLVYGINNMKADGKNILKLGHITKKEGAAEGIPVYFLIKNLPSWINVPEKKDDDKADDAADDDDAETSSVRPFNSFIRRLCLTLPEFKSSDDAKKSKISASVCWYCNIIIEEFLGMACNLLFVLVNNRGNKTVEVATINSMLSVLVIPGTTIGMTVSLTDRQEESEKDGKKTTETVTDVQMSLNCPNAGYTAMAKRINDDYTAFKAVKQEAKDGTLKVEPKVPVEKKVKAPKAAADGAKPAGRKAKAAAASESDTSDAEAAPKKRGRKPKAAGDDASASAASAASESDNESASSKKTGAKAAAKAAAKADAEVKTKPAKPTKAKATDSSAETAADAPAAKVSKAAAKNGEVAAAKPAAAKGAAKKK
jgi:hypothetical protein